MRTWGRTIEAARKAKDPPLSQEALAKKLGLSGSTVSRWESEEHPPDIPQLIALINELDMPAGPLLREMGVPLATPKASALDADFLNALLSFPADRYRAIRLLVLQWAQDNARAELDR
jgi:transcriptional regulator with XRE-family HTH domain